MGPTSRSTRDEQQATGGPAGTVPSRWGWAATIVLVAHILLLLAPPIPPYIKGSLWSYLLGYGSVVLWLVEFGGRGAELRLGWRRMATYRRWAVGAIGAAAVLAAGLGLRAYAPELFRRFSREEGLWEPLTLLCYLGAAVFLAALSHGPDALRKRWRFLAVIYAWLGLEEVDYFGIFGGLIGRIDGIYAGSLHDLIRLAAGGALSPEAAALIASAFVVAGLAAWRAGYLQPAWLISLARSRSFVWAVAGLALLFTAAAVEARPAGWMTGGPPPEELLEFVGAICLAVYALELAVSSSRRMSTRPRASTRSSAGSP